MKATVEKLDKNRVSLHIEVDEPRVDRAMQQACRHLAQQVSIPGFRRGRVPRTVLERRLGREAILQRALAQLWPEVYEEAVLDTAIEAIDVSGVDLEEQYEPGKPLKLKADVEVKPEVTLGEYKGIPVERTVVRVTEGDINSVLERMRIQHAELVTPERTSVERGDFITVDYTGFVDGKPFQGGAAKGYALQVGAGHFIPGFDEQLIGAELGEEREVKVTLPTGYGELSNKEAVFRVTVREIKERHLPNLDDEFAKDVSDFNTLAELREHIRGTLERQAAEDATTRMRSAVITEVTRRAEVEIPEVLVQRQLDGMLNDFAIDLALRGINPEAVLKDHVDSFRNDHRSQAEARVKTRLVLEAVAAREGIEVSAEEVEARIEQMAQGSRNADEVRQRYGSPTQRKQVEDDLRVLKAIDLIIGAAVVTEKVIERPAEPGPETSDAPPLEAEAAPQGGAEPEVAEAESEPKAGQAEAQAE